MGKISKEVIDNISQGIIVIDTNGYITIYNKKGKELFGIFESSKISHKAGYIKPKDLVFIVDNKLGEDDGKLTYRDLTKIGLYDKNISKGDSLLAFGIYETENNKKLSNYKLINKRNQKGEASLTGNYNGIYYKLEIDYSKKYLNICINEIEYVMDYRYAAGHMVIIRENELIFYQSKGYTARNESLKYILEGKNFLEKGTGAKVINPIGKHIFEVHEKNNEIEMFFTCAVLNDKNLVNEFMNINGISTLASITPLYSDGVKLGAMLRVEDVTELKEVIDERNILLKDLKKAERLLEEESAMKKFKNFDGVSSHINNIKKIAYKSAQTDSTVLILGESGTGKTTLAEEIHNLSPRKSDKFVHINCASLPENLLESELFGYAGGAFTNSKKTGKVGLLELANGGTLFLDEIGEISLKIQSKLLNFLQKKTFYRVGGIEEIKVNTRIICATNKNLEEAMAKKEFREDLYYRINIIPIYVHPLRERPEDIPCVANKLARKISHKLKRENIIITAEAMNKLLAHKWTGNIRELENVLERSISLSDSNIINSNNIWLTNKNNEDRNIGDDLKTALERAEKNIIINALKSNGGKINATLMALNIGKTSFYDKIKKYNIDLKSFY